MNSSSMEMHLRTLSTWVIKQYLQIKILLLPYIDDRKCKNLFKDINFETILAIQVREHSLNYSSGKED